MNGEVSESSRAYEQLVSGDEDLIGLIAYALVLFWLLGGT